MSPMDHVCLYIRSPLFIRAWHDAVELLHPFSAVSEFMDVGKRKSMLVNVQHLSRDPNHFYNVRPIYHYIGLK